MLKVEGLVKVYPKKKEQLRALDGVSFSVGRGEMVGLLGPNGAGKTTTVKVICGLVTPDKGRVEVVGYDPWRQRRQALAHLSAVLEGNRNIYWPLTVKENLEFFAALKGSNPRRVKDRIDFLMERLKLKNKADVTARSLSRGMQQKLALAVALVVDVPVLILDEPTLGLDVESAIDIREMLQQVAVGENKTILLTTHDMRLVRAICPRVIIINKGHIVTDDAVDNLLRLFDVKSYRLNLQGRLTARQKEDLMELDHIEIQEDRHNGTSINLNLEQADKLYLVMDILRRTNMVVEAIERREVDFEEVFLQIVGRGNSE